ncbi:hypothetical protein RclHR1_14720005 [Rhizophagus clarus]|uniref:Uncharacterized protein n=1 Tax=Rhizophagus clarus TaxID=94130 RepID=A0A2Z6QSR7_9GLOM|nr:hypothetical protein RclHR1_14720005 [Rhizophagus clarus]
MCNNSLSFRYNVYYLTSILPPTPISPTNLITLSFYQNWIESCCRSLYRNPVFSPHFDGKNWGQNITMEMRLLQWITDFGDVDMEENPFDKKQKLKKIMIQKRRSDY